jgi:hypothetical protein
MPIPDTDPLSWDDPTYGGKRPIVAGLDSLNRYGLFNGPFLASSITTGDFQSAPGMRAFVNGVTPIVDAPTVKVAVGHKNQIVSNAVVWQPASSPGVDGVCPQRIDARYMRFRATTDASDVWSRATGIEVDMQAGGAR